MKLKIYLFRHGQTYFNRDHRFTGWKDSKLTPQGIKDAKKVALKLKNKKFQVAYQTRLSRSKDTLKPVLKYHPECKEIITDDRMIERSYGKLQGQSHTGFVDRVGEKAYDVIEEGDVIDDFAPSVREKVEDLIGKAELQIIRRSYDVPPPGGESVKDVEKRVKSFLKDLLKKMKKEKVNVAISAHGNSMRPFRRYFEKLTIKQMMKLENPWDDYFEYSVDVK
ncbi:MAG: 2,3-bisphosphoglycerate-dependent phosphoglycerate mutase [Candidatus Woesearchaeota archaeon]